MSWGNGFILTPQNDKNVFANPSKSIHLHNIPYFEVFSLLKYTSIGLYKRFDIVINLYCDKRSFRFDNSDI